MKFASMINLFKSKRKKKTLDFDYCRNFTLDGNKVINKLIKCDIQISCAMKLTGCRGDFYLNFYLLLP